MHSRFVGIFIWNLTIKYCDYSLPSYIKLGISTVLIITTEPTTTTPKRTSTTPPSAATQGTPIRPNQNIQKTTTTLTTRSTTTIVTTTKTSGKCLLNFLSHKSGFIAKK